MALRLGKLPFIHDSRDFQWARYREPGVTLPTHPVTFGYGKQISAWGMLGNDRAGDCVWASAAHQTMLWNVVNKRTVPFSDASVLSDYSAVTGYDPVTGANDNGTVIRDALSYRRKTGILDANGNRHTIGAYVSLQPGNINQLLEALYLFGIVEIGIQFPSYAMDQFHQGKAWTYRPNPEIIGGHDIPLVARPSSRYLQLVTWARMISASNLFIKNFCDEAWVIISPEFLNGGLSPLGFNMAQLQADLNAL